MVVLTALKYNVVENSMIGGLVADELQVWASRYAMASSSDFTEFSFLQDLYTTMSFTSCNRPGRNS